MDDMIYRNDPIAEENIDPHGRPATDEFEEWSERGLRTDRYRIQGPESKIRQGTGETYPGDG